MVGVKLCARSKWRRARRVALSSTPSDWTAYPSFASAIWAARTRRDPSSGLPRKRAPIWSGPSAANVVRRWAPTIDAACPARQARLRTLCQAPTPGWRAIRPPQGAQRPRPALEAHAGRLARRSPQERSCLRKPARDHKPLKRIKRGCRPICSRSALAPIPVTSAATPALM